MAIHSIFYFVDGTNLTQVMKTSDPNKAKAELDLEGKEYHTFRDDRGFYEVKLSSVKYVRYVNVK